MVEYLCLLLDLFLVASALRRSCNWSLGLVSLFNGISTLLRLFNAKAILLEELVVLFNP